MKKRALSLFLALILCLGLLPLTAAAAGETVASGYCGADEDGKNLSWTLTDDGSLTISGTGKMKDYLGPVMLFAPWFTSGVEVRTVDIREGVTNIGEDAFYKCSDLTEVSIPASLTTIGLGAFDGCDALSSFTVAERNSIYAAVDGVLFNKDKSTLIQYPAGNSRTAYKVPDGVTTIGEDAFYGCGNLTTVTLPDSLTTIEEYAFFGCQMTSVTIPMSVTAIGEEAFCACFNLTDITVAAENPVYAAEDGALFNKEKTTLIWYLSGNPRTVYAVPDGVTTIDDLAFIECSLANVTFPDSLTTIGTEAFEYCQALSSVTFPKNVTTIGDLAFQYCDAMTEVKFMGNAPTVRAIDAYSMASNDIQLLDVGYESGIFAGDTLTAYYPQGNSTWTEEARAKLGENADVTWVPFDAGPSKPATYTVTVWAAQHGKVTASPKEGTAGTKVTLTVTPDKGYELDTLVVKQLNGTAVKVTNNTFTMPASDVTVTPTFKELPPETYTVTVSNAQHGKVTASPVKGTAGTKITLAVTPDKGYELDTLTVKQANGKTVTVAADNTFTMPASNVTVTATFKALPVDRLSLNRSSVSVSVGGSASVTATVSGYAGKHVYAISSDTSVATASVSGKTVRVKGVAQGAASVYVVMADTNAMTLDQAKADPSMKEIKVTVTKASSGGGSTGGGGSSGGGGASGGSSGGSAGGSTSTTPTTPESTTPTTPASQTFGDVEKGSWYESGVTFVVSKGLFNGVGDGAFAPQQNMTRAMLMTVLARLDGQSTDGGATWYSKGMDWAKAQGISDGADPEGNITREQLVTMLYRYAKSPAATGGLDDFADASAISAWATDAMRWAVQNGILTGKGDARLDPQGLATRAEVAIILQRYVEK